MGTEDRIDIDGHSVDPSLADRFFNASDGSRVTDEQWDEDKRRREQAPPDDQPLWTPVGGEEA